MGQRFQAFVITYNPVVKLEKAYKNKGENYWNSHPADKAKVLDQITQFQESFGTQETTFLVYHNQWIYGRGALIAASNVFSFNQNSCDHDNPFKLNNGFNAE